MNGTLAIQCTSIKDGQYLFVMNIFNCEVGVGQSAQPVSATFPMTGFGTNDSSNQPLGYDMYFSQTVSYYFLKRELKKRIKI